MSEDNDLGAPPAQSKPEKCWRVACEGTDDGSGDVIVTLPDELCSAMGWAIGEILKIQLRLDNTLVLSKKE